MPVTLRYAEPARITLTEKQLLHNSWTKPRGPVTSEVDSNANASDNTGTITKTYDSVGRLTQELLPNGQSNTYAYDQTGNLQTFTDSGGTVTYGYDPVNDLSRIAEPSGSCTTRPATLCSTFAYDTNDNRTQAKLADGVTETTDWTPGGRMQDTTAKDSTGQVLTSDNYGYTQSGKFGPLIASMTDQDGYEQSYSYDTLDRLTGLTSSSNPATDNVSWSFDGAGNRTQETHPAGQSTWQWSFNADDQTCYIQSTSCSSPPSGAVAYTFDADGNQTGGPTPSLAYNARNQTVSIGGTTEVYQGAGQSDLVKDGQIALQNNAMGIGVISDPTNGTDHLVREPDGQLFSSLQNNKREYFLFDAQNDVVGEANNSGQLDFKVRYSSPYDESDWYMIQNVPVYFAFKSGYWTAGSYYHFGERYYDTWAGRFTQPDQVAHPYDVKQYDAYGFVANNPIMLSDPLGLESYGSACGSEAETGAAVGAVTGPEDAAVGAATGCATGIVKKFTTDEFGKTAGEVVGVLANFKTGSDLVKGAESVASDVGDALDSVF